jgi:hypothetical protein
MTYSNFFLIPDEIVSSRSEPTHALRTWVAPTLILRRLTLKGLECQVSNWPIVARAHAPRHAITF